MKKFWTVMLRIIMVMSFIGAFSFVGIAIVTNQGIEFESYKYIIKKFDETDFSAFESNVKANVKLTYGSSNDKYTDFLANACAELNEGINYFLDFLAIESGLQKGDHNILIDGFNDYLQNFDKANDAYDDYMSAYSKAEDTSGATYACNLVISSEKMFSDAYLKCYKSGSLFFKNLARIVREYSFDNMGLSYSCQNYAIKVGLCDYVALEVFTVTRGNIDINQLKIIFDNFCLNGDSFGDEDVIINNNFKKFVDILNLLNIYEWAGNYNAYATSLSNASDALWAKDFFDEGRF
ncbi:MAG: hypothetical protein EOM55_00640 [Clostridia bacterium]|nr:hypothetical protein [Clostridia bacterium]